MKHVPFLLIAVALAGCSTYTTKQTDVSPDRTVTTEVRVRTFWDSDSELANSRALQTDKSQSAVLGALSQSSTSTNVVKELETVLQILKTIKTPLP